MGNIFKAILGYIKKNPKVVAVVIGTVVGGTTGKKVKDLANKIPD